MKSLFYQPSSLYSLIQDESTQIIRVYLLVSWMILQTLVGIWMFISP